MEQRICNTTEAYGGRLKSAEVILFVRLRASKRYDGLIAPAMEPRRSRLRLKPPNLPFEPSIRSVRRI
jgi:hypothetical protein